ncbi:MAG: octanoyltransferase [Ignavibacterium sp.]|nr:MAG: octanoyltransferase [Ignavibacterium sp.]
MQKRKLNIINLGVEPYKKIWDFQHQLHKLRVDGKIDDVFILLEHSNVYTLGKIAKREHLLVSPQKLTEEKIDLFEIDRGGDITYHGPGQIVGYPIIKLDNLYQDIHRYLRELEEIIIQTLKVYQIDGERHPKYTGVWIGNEKIAAIGIKVSRWVTMHGFAFNINTDLSYFGKIIPCGITDKGVTSLENILKKKISIEEVKSHLIENFVQIFRYDDVHYYFSIEEFSNSQSSILLEGVNGV